MWRINKIRTTPYHPMGNGVCERVNGTLIRGLQRMQAANLETDWDLLLPRVVFAYNTAVHSSTGFTPYRLMFGEDCRFPVQLRVDEAAQETTPPCKAKEVLASVAQACASVRQSLFTKHKASKAYYDLGATARHFKVGDKVRIHLKSMGRRKGKLDAAWSAPMDILEVRGAVLTLGNQNMRKTITVHSDKTILLTPGLRPEHITPVQHVAVDPAREEQAVEVDVHGDDLDVADQVEPTATRLEELDFLSQPRAPG